VGLGPHHQGRYASFPLFERQRGAHAFKLNAPHAHADFIGERVIAIAELQRERMETETWYGLCPANVSTPDPSLGEIKLAFKWS
jgi:hypothetical protein